MAKRKKQSSTSKTLYSISDLPGFRFLKNSALTVSDSQESSDSFRSKSNQPDTKSLALETINKYRKEIEKLSTELKNTKDDFQGDVRNIKKEIQKSKNEYEAKIETSKTKATETLGIFVALFTFVSLEFKIFSEAQSFSHLILLTLVMAGVLIFFVLVLDVVINPPEHRRKNVYFYILLFSFSVLLIVGGVTMSIVDPDFKAIRKERLETDNSFKEASSSSIIENVVSH